MAAPFPLPAALALIVLGLGLCALGLGASGREGARAVAISLLAPAGLLVALAGTLLAAVPEFLVPREGDRPALPAPATGAPEPPGG